MHIFNYFFQTLIICICIGEIRVTRMLFWVNNLLRMRCDVIDAFSLSNDLTPTINNKPRKFEVSDNNQQLIILGMKLMNWRWICDDIPTFWWRHHMSGTFRFMPSRPKVDNIPNILRIIDTGDVIWTVSWRHRYLTRPNINRSLWPLWPLWRHKYSALGLRLITFPRLFHIMRNILLISIFLRLLYGWHHQNIFDVINTWPGPWPTDPHDVIGD